MSSSIYSLNVDNLCGVFIYNNSIYSNFIALLINTQIVGNLNETESDFTTENSIYHKNNQYYIAQTES